MSAEKPRRRGQSRERQRASEKRRRTAEAVTAKSRTRHAKSRPVEGEVDEAGVARLMADERGGRRAVLSFGRRSARRQSDSDTEIVAEELQPARARQQRLVTRARAKDATADAPLAVSSATLSSQLMWRLALRMSFYNDSRLLQHLSRSILSRSAHKHADRKSFVEERSFFTRPADVPPSPTPSSARKAPTGVQLIAYASHSHGDPDAASSPERCAGKAVAASAAPGIKGPAAATAAGAASTPTLPLASQKAPFSPAHALPPFPPLVFSPATKTQKRARGMTLREYVDWEHVGIRPGLSIRVVRAEIVGSMPAVTEFVVHVVDLHTKVFWITKKKSNDFYMLRRKIRSIIRRASAEASEEQEVVRFLLDLPFPRRRFRSASAESLGRDMTEMELFLRNVAALEPSMALQRSILQELQLELCSAEFITSLEHIDTTGEPPEPKWLAYDLFRSLNSSATVEGCTCYKFLSAFANRCAVIQAAVCPICHAFEDTALSVDALRDLRTTVTSIEKYLLDHLEPQYGDTLSVLDQSVNVQSIVEDCVFHAVEDTILVPLEKQIAFLVGSTVDADVEARLAANIEKMRHRSQTECGIPEHLQSEDNWGLSCHHLSMIDERPLPADKIQELLRAALEIFKNCGEKNLEWRENSALTADDYLPIHIYVVVNSGLKRPLVTKELLGAMIHPSQMLGEVGYFLTMFEVALKYIADM